MRALLRLGLLASVLMVRVAQGGWSTGVPYSGSWGTQWAEQGYGGTTGPNRVWAGAPFDTFAIRIVEGTVNFESPGIVGFSDASWRQVHGNAKFVVGHGNPISTVLSWYLALQDPVANFTAQYVCYAPNGDRLLSQEIGYDSTHQHAGQYSGNWFWTYHLPDGWDPGRANLLIPAPAGALLGVIGLGLVGWVKRRI